MNIKKFATIAVVVSLPSLFAGGCSKSVEPIITKAEYDKIKEEMTLPEVEAIVGVPGEKHEAPGIAGETIVSYTWKNDSENKVLVAFGSGDKVIGKSYDGELP